MSEDLRGIGRAQARHTRNRLAFEARRLAAGLCRRCGGPVGNDRIGKTLCQPCNARKSFQRKKPPTQPLAAGPDPNIERAYRAALAQIERARRSGDPAWQIEPWAMRDRWANEAVPDTTDLRGDGVR